MMNTQFDGMDKSDVLDMMTRFMVKDEMQEVQTHLPALLIARLGGDAQRFTAEYILQMAVAMFYTAISMPYGLIAAMGDLIMWSDLLVKAQPDFFTLPELVRKVKGVFEDISPAFAVNMTEDVLRPAILLTLLDWARLPELPDEETLKQDIHFYLHGASLTYGVKVDKSAAVQEAYTSLRRELEAAIRDGDERKADQLSELLKGLADEMNPDDIG